MFFIVDNSTGFNINILKDSAYRAARFYILKYKVGKPEIDLNNYLIANYKTSLKLMCLRLLDKLDFNTDANDHIIISFHDSASDKVASLITYGNSKLFGSKILINALTALNKRNYN